MTRLSICVPVSNNSTGLDTLLTAITADRNLDLEVLLAGPAGLQPSVNDPRIRILPAIAEPMATQDIWASLIEASSGTWVTLVKPEDMLEPELALMVEFLESANPAVDALSWSNLQIDASDPPDRRFSVAIPSQHTIVNIDKTAMLKAFFMWAGSSNVPRMPFGLYHGALKRTLARTIVEGMRAAGRISPLPVHEWAARTLLMANELAYCERPMSVVAKQPFAPDPAGVPSADFPFNAAIGQTAGIAEVQHAVFKEMGAPWGGGAEETFARAAAIDCMMETDARAFAARCQAYFNAFKRWDGGRHASLFQPHFAGPQPPDIRRGLHGNMLMVDRFIGKARTAQDFYRIMRSFLVPVRLICGDGIAA